MKISDLEDAIEAALTPLVTDGTVTAVKLLSEDVSKLNEVFARLGVRPPFIAIIYNGGPFNAVNKRAGRTDHRPAMKIFMGVTNLRSNSSARSGLYEILAQVVNRLQGKVLGLDIEPISIGPKIELAAYTDQALVYAVDLQTRFAWVSPEEVE